MPVSLALRQRLVDTQLLVLTRTFSTASDGSGSRTFRQARLRRHGSETDAPTRGGAGAGRWMRSSFLKLQALGDGGRLSFDA